jgi:hypothetical protein
MAPGRTLDVNQASWPRYFVQQVLVIALLQRKTPLLHESSMLGNNVSFCQFCEVAKVEMIPTKI